MKKITGIGVSAGIAYGPIYRYENQPVVVEHKTAADPQAELARLEASLAIAKTELEAVLEAAMQRVGAKEADIFQRARPDPAGPRAARSSHRCHPGKTFGRRRSLVRRNRALC